MKSYKELIVWEKSCKLVLEIYKITSTFPGDEKFGIISQMRRAAVAIPSNIAEGYMRGSKKEYIQFLRIAFGSGAELETQLIISQKLGYIQHESLHNATLLLLSEVMKMLNAIISKLSNTYVNTNT